MGQPAFDLSHDTDKVINVETSTSRTSNHSNATRSQTQRLHNLPGHSNLFLRLRSKRDSDRVANAFIEQNAQSDGRFHSATKRSACFGDAEVKRIINLLR